MSTTSKSSRRRYQTVPRDEKMIHLPAPGHQKVSEVMKEEWVAQKLKARTKEFTNEHPLSVFIGSWNVNGKLTLESLAPWLIEGFQSSPANKLPDLYVLGFQEVDLSTEAFLLNDSPLEDFWVALVQKTLSQISAVSYIKVCSRQMVGLLMIVFAKSSLLPYISGLQMDTKGCGVLGMGNKGAVACKLNIYNSVLCFVNSHLAADSSMVDRRNLDYQELSRRITFTDPRNLSPVSIWDADLLFWFGDLNYRIALPEEEVKELLTFCKDSYEVLLEHDQLLLEKKEGRAFSEFTEPKINFHPTYKYDPGTDQFDSSEKKRAPSWCDRVLYRTNDPVTAQYYESIMQIKTSDHKPVRCLLTAKVAIVDSEKRAATQQTILRELDRYENESLPNVNLSTHALDFGQVSLNMPVMKELILENTGSVLAQVRFIPKLQEAKISPDWLYIRPPMSILMPGEKLSIRFTCLMDARHSQQTTLEDILILHLENGKDYFISVSAQPKPLL